MTKCSSRRSVLMVIGGTVLCGCSAAVTDGDASEAGDADPGSPDVDPGDSTTVECLPIRVGSLSMFPVGAWKVVSVSRVPYVIARDDQGLYAYSASCTHQGTTISVNSSTGVGRCPSHGAMFDGNGTVTLGPARASLRHYPISVCNGDVFIDDTLSVPASTRTPVL